MRTRDALLDNIEGDFIMQFRMLEVLIDIRDLLVSKVEKPTEKIPQYTDYPNTGEVALSLSEQMQGDLEPLPGAKWDGDDIGRVLKHGRE